MHPMAAETLRRYGVAHKHIKTSDIVESIVELVTHGAGIAILPGNLVAERMRTKQLVRVFKELAPERLDFVIARHRDQDQAIIKHIVETAL